MKLLHNLTSEERDKINVLQGEGLSIRKIAKELGCIFSTNFLRFLIKSELEICSYLVVIVWKLESVVKLMNFEKSERL